MTGDDAIELRTALARELVAHQDATTAGDDSAAWLALERAHVLSQPMLVPHLRVHLLMLALAWYTRDGREVAGQLLRIVLAPLGHVTGRTPPGNTGRSNVSAFAPMSVPDDLAALLERVAYTPAENGGRVARRDGVGNNA